MVDRLVSMDLDNDRLPDRVRQRLADDMADPATVEGARLSATFVTVVNIPAPTPAKLQAAIASAVSSGKRQRITVPSGSTIILTDASPLVVDVSFVDLDLQGSVIDASAMTTGAAVTVTGSVSPPYGQATQAITHADVLGPGAGSNVVGLLFSDAAGYSPAHTNYRGMSIHGFGAGVQFDTDAYILNFFGCDIWGNGTALNMPSASSNYGERLSFFGCTIFNNDLGLNTANGAGAWHFFGCSFDYNQKQFQITAGRVFLNACHVEGSVSSYTSIPIELSGDGATFVMSGGWMLCTGAGVMSVAYIVSNGSTGKGGAWFEKVSMNNMRASSDHFATGAGSTVLRGTSSYGITDLPVVIGGANTPLLDGGFEQSAIQDDIFITGDTQPITDRYTGTNIKLALDTSVFQSGAKSLKVTKTFGGGSVSSFMVAVPIDRLSLAGCEFWWSKPGAETGSFSYSFIYAAVRVGANGVPASVRNSTFGTGTVPLTSSPNTWTRLATGSDAPRAPEWATHFVLSINLGSFVGPGSIYLDDLNIGLK